jgi:uncharacterized phage-associated protein
MTLNNSGSGSTQLITKKERTMAKAIDVSAFIINESNKPDSNDLTQLKLQKLLYYCQGYYLAIQQTPLFSDEIQAWEHGPVVRNVYDQYTEKGIYIVEDPKGGKRDLLTEEEQSICLEVLEVLGQFSAWRLREMTHKEAPWVEAFSVGKSTPISQESLKSYFETLVA